MPNVKLRGAKMKLMNKSRSDVIEKLKPKLLKGLWKQKKIIK